jgi:Flp pilus assembly protein CpaB
VVAQFDVVSVPVPVEPIPAGVQLHSVRFKTMAYPAHQLPDGALRDLSEIPEHAVALTLLPADLPLFRVNISTGASGKNPVIERIPAGMRAITVRVDATAAVEGWAGSGAVVDVLLVENDRTTVVAEGVKILSAERSVSPIEGAAAPSVPSTVTLLVTQDQCLAVTTAIPRGKIAFALRSVGDEDSWRTTVYTAERLKGTASGTSASISGYASVRDDDEQHSFALANGKWLRTDAVPQGFLENRVRP